MLEKQRSSINPPYFASLATLSIAFCKKTPVCLQEHQISAPKKGSKFK
jgi:hypothetical protein